jgi:hypothetical protein
MVTRNAIQSVAVGLLLFTGFNANAQESNSDAFGMSESEQEVLTSFGDLITMIGDWDILNAAFDAVEDVYDLVDDAISEVQSVMTNILDNLGVLQPAIDAFNSAVGLLNSAIQTLNELISSIEAACSVLEGVFSDFLGGIGDFAGDVIDGVGDGLEDIGDGLGDVGEDIGDGLEEICFFCLILSDNGEPFAIEAGQSESGANTGGSVGPLAAFSSVGNDGTSSALHPTYAVSSFSDNYFFQNPVIVNPIFDETTLDVNLNVFQLEHVDNTSDIEKPVSQDAAIALNHRAEWRSVPIGQFAQGAVNDLSFDEDFLYVCIAPNQWSKVPLNSQWN